MNRMRGSLLLAAALLVNAGCAPSLLHRGPAVTTVRVAETGESKAQERAKQRAAKQAAKAEKRAAAQKRHDEAMAAKAARAEAKRSGLPSTSTAVAAEPRTGKSKKPAAATVASPVSNDPVAEARARATQNPSEPFWPYKLAQIELEKQRLEPAERALQQAIERDHAYAPALTALSRLYYQQGRHAEALAMLEPVRAQQVSLPPADRAAVLAGLAMHQAALGDDVSARATLDRLTRDERDQVPGVAAWLAVRDTSAVAARNATDVALRMEPKTAANHNNRGIALLRSGDPDGAAKAFERAIELDPSLAGPYYNLAILERWYRLDRVAAATRFREYWSRSHADPDSLYAELGHAPAAPIAEEGPNR